MAERVPATEPEFPAVPEGGAELHSPSSDSEDAQAASAVVPAPTRRRSTSRHSARGHSRQRSNSKRQYYSDYEGPAPSRSVRSSRPLRYEERDEWEDEYYPARERDYGRDEGQGGRPHPDLYTRRSVRGKPPRAYLNRPYQYEEEPSPTPTKSYFAETQTQVGSSRIQDEEMGYGKDSSNGPRFTWKDLSPKEKAEVLRLPWTEWMNSNVKNHFVASLGEFIGTTMFLLFAFAGTEVANIQSQANNSSSSSSSNSTTGGTTGFNVNVLMYIAMSFGFSLMVNVWIFFRISGGLFNPAVTFGMLLVRAISVSRAVCLFVAQILGSMLASVIARFLFPENFNVRTTLGGGTSVVQGVFIEAVLTAELVFCIFMLAKEKHRATFMAPIGIGMTLFIAELVGVQFTGGSLNPARSFGPCVITLTFDSEHWIYWVGPFAGTLIAVAFYKFIKILEYELANPGADGDLLNDPTKNPEKLAQIKREKHASA